MPPYQLNIYFYPALVGAGLAVSLNMFSGALLSPVALVHAQGSFAYTLFTPAGIRLTPGNSGTTTIVATLTAGEEHASNVTLACDLISLPPANFSGTTCS